jgi:DNA-directed RNA polymerase subunit RPC12/RpoP
MTEELRKELNCQSCGAPIEYLTGEATLTCGYCGNTLMMQSMGTIVPVEKHYLLAPKVDDAGRERSIRQWMSTGFFKPKDLPQVAVLEIPEGVVLPFWVVACRSFTQWSGMNRRTRRVGSGKHSRTETYWEPASGNFQNAHNWSVYARRGEEWYGIDALNPGALKTEADWGGFFLGFGMGSESSQGVNLMQGATKFEIKQVGDKLTIKNGQINQQQAEEEARGQITRFSRSVADGRVTTLTDCDTQITVDGTYLVHLPLWIYRYKYEGKSFRLLVNGFTGQIVKGEHPVGKYDKLIVLLVFLLVVGGVIAFVVFLIASKK